MLIDQFLIQDDSAIYYDPDFRNMIEDHLSFLRVNTSTRVEQIDPHDALVNEFDLFSYLLARGYKAYQHWIIMRMNFMTATTDMNADITQLLIPDPIVIGQLMSSFKTGRKIQS